MSQIVVREEIRTPAALLWRLVADFGNVPWMPGGDTVRREGQGSGMVRMFGGGETEIRERLEEIDEAGRAIVYTIPSGLPLPVKDYRATMRVHVLDADASELEWSCSFVPDGVSESEAAAQLEGLYRMMIGWIRDYLARAA